MDKQMDKRRDRQTNGQINGLRNRLESEKWMEGWTKRWTDGQNDRQTESSGGGEERGELVAQYTYYRMEWEFSKIFKITREIVAFILLVHMIFEEVTASPDCLVCRSVSFLSAYNSSGLGIYRLICPTYSHQIMSCWLHCDILFYWYLVWPLCYLCFQQHLSERYLSKIY